ncbi:hypothetical protein PMI07_006148 [Rhizobium sp. CF080]|uniref:hypothetical protein n=1 Tax=Rhizobium sp. (strain CF080) TaxID=1144310 RepID=UPI0003E7D53D|nr:hypothetical protein [Rhizobium sp. CF080]EUB99867.1 hypothetical protein PMI07_006148 [Rhizobium sp. CF080]
MSTIAAAAAPGVLLHVMSSIAGIDEHKALQYLDQEAVNAKIRCETLAPSIEESASKGAVRPAIEVVDMAFVKLQHAVSRTGMAMEIFAAAGLRHHVLRPVQDKDRQRDLRELPLQALVGADHLGNSLGGLRLIGNQWIGIHRRHDSRIARRILVLQGQNMGMRGPDLVGNVVAMPAGETGFTMPELDLLFHLSVLRPMFDGWKSARDRQIGE